MANELAKLLVDVLIPDRRVARLRFEVGVLAVAAVRVRGAWTPKRIGPIHSHVACCVRVRARARVRARMRVYCEE